MTETITTLIVDNGKHYDIHQMFYVRAADRVEAEILRNLIMTAGLCTVFAIGEMEWFGDGGPVGIEANETWLRECFGWHEDGVERMRALLRLAPSDVAQRVLAALQASL